ncbi:CRISPR associated protein Cas1 [Dendrosporobacter quercicolus]|uniref:CRISPR associated protein Cas1 n=1 Tax=Dendrosporobacter quercicolus TaxID=146817 RepID=A0A1G9U5K9_9FIRM|nr:CRISPR-associated endonuclease Cas1 [Dendrosporobacter quercicolus]SDM55178.1 CRISPR associated protein Cas1 [Dendrosporobacter quercicolus]
MKEETRYIFSKGDLSRKDFSICFRGERGNIYLPIKDTKELYCFNDITLSTKLLEILAKAGISYISSGTMKITWGHSIPKTICSAAG